MSSNEDKKGWGILIAVFLLIALLWGYHARRNGMKEAAESSASDTSLTEIIASADSVSAMTDSKRKSRKSGSVKREPEVVKALAPYPMTLHIATSSPTRYRCLIPKKRNNSQDSTWLTRFARI